jgi:steroid delta-isomerase-like uncharacterized protein
MSAENKTVVRRWFEEVWNEGRESAIDELMAPHAVFHGLGPAMHGPAAFKLFYAAYRQALPDVRIVVDDLIAEGDRVALRWTATATHRGDGLGIPATGREVRFSGMGFARVERGQLVEGFNTFDQLGLLTQLGAVQQPQ